MQGEQTLMKIGKALMIPYELFKTHGASMIQTYQPFFDMCVTFAADMQHLGARMQEYGNGLYETNRFYARDTVRAFYANTGEMRSSWQHFTERLVGQFAQLREMMEAANALIFDAQWWINAFDQATLSMTEWMNSLGGHPRTQYMKNKWEEFQNLELSYDWLDDLDMPAVATISCEERYNAFKDQAAAFWADLMAQPALSHYQESMQSLQDSMIWALEYYGVNAKMSELSAQMEAARNGGLREFVEAQVQKTKDHLQLHRTRVTVWEPENWEAQAEMYLPFEMRDLETLNRIPAQIGDFMQQQQNQMTRYGEQVNNWAYGAGFSRHATWAEPQHFMTFDRKFFEFEGTCSYVLARDVVNDEFSVIVNYHDHSPDQQSVLVKIDSHRIEVAHGFKVHIDGVRTEMPVKAGTTSITLVDNRVHVESPRGITLECDLFHNRCTLEVKGWYFGKVKGLFGTYNNEPIDDFQDPNGNIIEDVASLADAWTDGNRCVVQNHAVKDEFSAHEICDSYFRSPFSSFSACFDVVDSENFMYMCVNDLARKDAPTEEDVCRVASFYADECERAHVHLEAPTQCLHCEMPAGERLYVEEPQKLEGADVPQSADVLLVVSHRECNTEVIPKLAALVDRINGGFIAEGMENNHFGLVGYGGKDAYYSPHSYTLDGQFLATFDRLSSTVENFHIDEGVATEDALSALEFAARYHFRAGVRKTIILVPCSSCAEMEVSYSEVHSLLSDRDINLSMLMHEEFAIDKANPTTSLVFGVDRQTVYTRTDFGNVGPAGDVSLRPHVAVPKDYCTALTDYTNGALFNTRFMTSGRPQQEKKFMDVMSAVVAMKARPFECEVCECVAPTDSHGYATTVCRACEQPSVFYSIFRNNFDNFERQNRVI